MTKDEVLNNYGQVLLYFSSYYKYKFFFVGKAADGALITVSYGGSADDIYHYDIYCSRPETLKEHWPNYISIEKDKIEIFHEYNY